MNRGRAAAAARRRVMTVRAVAVSAAIASAAVTAQADPPPRVTVDRPVARFFAPEIGGTEQPRFVNERTLAFEARLEVIADRRDGIGEGYDERQVRAALDHHVGEEMLASLAHKLIAGSPPWQRPAEADLARLRDELRAALFERLGGKERVEAAAGAEELDASEVDALLARQALAAWYIDRAVVPVLQPTDEQLREVFRTAAHPYRGQAYEQVRPLLRGWFIIERLRAAEGAFLEGARTRVRVVAIP